MRTLNLTGHKYNHLTCLAPSGEVEPTNGAIKWICRCDCGAIHIVNSNNLRTGHVKTCGCGRRKKL